MRRVYQQIPLALPVQEVLRRMGHNRHHTILTPQQEKRVDDLMQEAFALCRPAGMFLFLPITGNDGSVLRAGTPEEGVVFSSSALCRLMTGCERLVLLACTVGAEASELAGQRAGQGLGTDAIVCDATASETADAAMDWLCALLNRELPRTGGRLTANRFSPGYGDLALDAQAAIFRVLRPQEIGISLTDSNMMIPEKSVTALAGVLSL